MEQRSEEWFEFRQKHIGASEVGAIMSVCPYRKPQDVWHEKVTGERKDLSSNPAVQRGIMWEDTIRDLYQRTYGLKLTTPTLEYEKWPILSASLDGLSKSEHLIVEFKYPGEATFEAAKTSKKVPLHYMMQIQTQMLIAKARQAHFVCFRQPDELAVVEIQPDKTMQNMILYSCFYFWQLVEKRIEIPELRNSLRGKKF